MASTSPVPNIFPEIVYDDVPRIMDWLEQAFGFVRGEVIAGPDQTVAHAEMHFDAGTVMLQSTDGAAFATSAGNLGGVAQRLYVAVTDPDPLYHRARGAGAEVVWDLADTDYGARMFAVRDPEGQIWGFGTYRPDPTT